MRSIGSEKGLRKNEQSELAAVLINDLIEAASRSRYDGSSDSVKALDETEVIKAELIECIEKMANRDC